MPITAFPLQLAGLKFGQEPMYRMLDHVFSAGIVSGLGVVQNPAGADLSVTVQTGDAYVAMTGGGKRQFIVSANSNSGIPGQLNAAEWLATFTAAHATLPRIDRVVAEVQDSLVDGGSGHYRGMLRVVAGTATSGATLANLSGAPAVPANCVHVRHVLVPAGATAITNAEIGTAFDYATVGGVAQREGLAQAFSASGSVRSRGGRTVRFSGSTAAQTLTLPAAGSGLEFLVHNIATVPVTIACATGEYIGGATNTTIVLAPGAKVTLIGSSGSWYPAWDLGEQVASGYQELATDVTGNGDKASITIAGDGVTPVQVVAHAHLGSNAAGHTIYAFIRDGAAGAGTAFRKAIRITDGAANAYTGAVDLDVTIPAFTGSKSLYLYCTSTGTLYNSDATWATKRWIRAIWAPGQYTANP